MERVAVDWARAEEAARARRARARRMGGWGWEAKVLEITFTCATHGRRGEGRGSSCEVGAGGGCCPNGALLVKMVEEG